MGRFSVATWVLLTAGFIPLSANAGSDDTGPANGKSSPPGVLSASEELGREAHRELARLGCFSGDVNTSWGRESRAAVKRFGQATKSAWPDWPTSELIRSLWTYPAGYCRTCETCATASTTPDEPQAKSSAAKPPAEAQPQKSSVPVATPVQKPPVAAPAGETPVAAPVEDHEQNEMPVVPRVARTAPDESLEPQENPEASPAESQDAEDLPPTEEARTIPEVDDERQPTVSLPARKPTPPVKADEPPRRASQPKRLKPHKKVARPGPAQAKKPVPPRRRSNSRRGNGWASGGGWPGGGPADSVGR